MRNNQKETCRDERIWTGGALLRTAVKWVLRRSSAGENPAVLLEPFEGSDDGLLDC